MITAIASGHTTLSSDIRTSQNLDIVAMKTSLYILTTIIAVATSLRGSIDEGQSSVEDEFVERVLKKTCKAEKSSALVYFEVETAVNPSADAYLCSRGQREKMGIRINTALKDVGVDDTDATTTMVAKVCVIPSSGGHRLLRDSQRFLTGGWTYNGGGVSSLESFFNMRCVGPH